MMSFLSNLETTRVTISLVLRDRFLFSLFVFSLPLRGAPVPVLSFGWFWPASSWSAKRFGAKRFRTKKKKKFLSNFASSPQDYTSTTPEI